VLASEVLCANLRSFGLVELRLELEQVRASALRVGACLIDLRAVDLLTAAGDAIGTPAPAPNARRAA
jgi:hypothetical protein